MSTEPDLSNAQITLRDLYRARQAIAPTVRRTPLVASASLSRTTGRSVWLKLETLQDTGSFKLRGATNALLNLSAAQRARGVTGVSTGNHGRGLAHAANRLDIPAVICMSHLVPENKVEGIRALGAEVRIVGQSQDEAQIEVDRLVAEEGMVMIPPFDHRDVIAGQGTIGLELLEDLPDLDTVLVPVSGGGLIAGIALALKTASSEIRVVGVSMERGAAMYQSQRAGRPVLVDELATLADCLGGGIGLDNRYTFEMVRDLVDDLILVGEEMIAAAMAHAYREDQLIVEGGGTVGIAALLNGLVEPLGRNVAVVLSGRNVDMDVFTRIVSGEGLALT